MRRKKKSRRKLGIGLTLCVIVLAVAGYCYWVLSRPLPTLKPVSATTTLEMQTPSTLNTIQWPGDTEAALGVVGTNVGQAHGTQVPKPTASLAKLVTALTVLQKYPLNVGEEGPTVTLTSSDVQLYRNYLTQDGSVVPVESGEHITEYQMLEAMMLPSANNMADSLAIWAYGSLPAYQTAANQYLADHALVSTHIGSDASGLSPSTTSTAHDLVQIGETVMQNPVLAQIVGKSSTTDIPLLGTVKNVNALLGQNNIVGIKTGNSDQAGGVYVSASHVTVNNRVVTLVTATMGTPDLRSAVQGSLPFIQTAQNNFATVTLVHSGSIISRYREPWGGTVPVVASQDLNVTTWSGGKVATTVSLQPISLSTPSGTTVGSVASQENTLVNNVSVPVTLQATPTKPSIWWRLLHPMQS